MSRLPTRTIIRDFMFTAKQYIIINVWLTAGLYLDFHIILESELPCQKINNNNNNNIALGVKIVLLFCRYLHIMKSV